MAWQTSGIGNQLLIAKPQIEPIPNVNTQVKMEGIQLLQLQASDLLNDLFRELIQ